MFRHFSPSEMKLEHLTKEKYCQLFDNITVFYLDIFSSSYYVNALSDIY